MGARGVAPELAVKMAIATSMATIIFTSISSVRAHHKRGAVRWDIVKGLAPGIVIGSLIASMGVFAILKGAWLALFFALEHLSVVGGLICAAIASHARAQKNSSSNR